MSPVANKPTQYVKSSVGTEESKLDDDDDDDDISYQSCVSVGHGDDTVLVDSAHTARFPQGNLAPYVINDPEFKLSWTMMTYGYKYIRKKGEIEFSMAYKCPTTDCKFVSNALAPIKNKIKFSKPALGQQDALTVAD